MRGSKAQLFLYAAGLFLGISVLVFSLAVRDQIAAVLESEALAVLGADASIRAKDPISEDLIKNVDSEQHLREVRFRSMVLFEDGTARLSQVRASEEGYPFYGQVHTNPPNIWQKLREGSNQVLLDESLLLSSAAAIGQVIKIGKSEFKIIGSVTKVPGVSLFNSAVAPRIYMSYQNAIDTGLLSRLSIADYFLYLKFSAAKAPAQIKLLSEGLPPEVTLETPQQRSERLGSINENIIIYFSLVGLACISLGALGAGTSVYFYLLGKLRDSAVFKSLGFKGAEVAAIYLIQLLIVSVVTSVVASAFGTLIYYSLISKLASFFTVAIEFSFPIRAFCLGVSLGVVTLLLVSFPGLIILKKTPTLLLLREGINIKLAKYEKLLLFVVALLLWPIFLLFVASPKEAFAYGFGLNVILAVLWSLSHLLKIIALKLGKFRIPFVLRYGILGLSRPANATTTLLNAFCLSLVLAATLFIVQHYFARQISLIKEERIANLFIYDVAEDQVPEIRNLLAAHSAPIAEEVPIVLMRITKLKDQATSALLKDSDSKIPAWTLKRDYWTSYRGEMLANEELVEGEWFDEYKPEEMAGVVPISVEDKLANRLQLKLGDLLEFDVQGVIFKTQIRSLRKIRWEQMQRNAFVVFPKGVLEEAPKFLFLTAYAADPVLSARIQRLLVEKFPGVSVVDIRFVADTLLPMLESIAQAIMVLAGLVILTACIILISTILSSKEKREKELQLLRILGATRKQTEGISFVEYFVLGLISSILAMMLSIAIAFALSIYVFKLGFSVPWLGLLILFSCSVILVCGISILSDKFFSSQPRVRI